MTKLSLPNVLEDLTPYSGQLFDRLNWAYFRPLIQMQKVYLSIQASRWTTY